jgi:hypothetical protein
VTALSCDEGKATPGLHALHTDHLPDHSTLQSGLGLLYCMDLKTLDSSALRTAAYHNWIYVVEGVWLTSLSPALQLMQKGTDVVQSE